MPTGTSASTPATLSAGSVARSGRLPDWRGKFRLELPDNHTTSHDARPLLLVLGLPTFGLAFAITILTTYGPSVLIRIAHSPAKVGALIGGEGAFALVVPLIAGTLSDRLHAPTPAGRRLPFVLIGAPLTGAGLLLLPFAPDIQLAGFAVLIFFVGYYLYYPPYRAIYADLLPRRLFARAQSNQAVQRGAGLGVALLAGGLLLSVWTPLPFIIGGAVLGLTTLALKPVVRLQQDCAAPDSDEEPGASARELLLENRKMQQFAAANALWEFSFAGLKTFIVLYVVRGLGHSPAYASAVIAIVAVAYVVGAPIAGWLSDRFGIVPVMTWAGLVYGIGLCFGIVARSALPLLIILPVAAVAGAILMTLPQALAFTLAPTGAQGAAAGLVDFSRGIGVVLGPVLVGATVSWSASTLTATHGYAAMWPTIGVPVLASLFLLRKMPQQQLHPSE